VINVGASSPVTILELAGLVQETLGIPQPLRARFIPYESFPGRYQDVRNRVPDVSKAQSLLGFTAQIALEEGLRRSLGWHRSLLDHEEAAQA
jgi:nucleoside-diphosphate-sugar epimerase